MTQKRISDFALNNTEIDFKGDKLTTAEIQDMGDFVVKSFTELQNDRGPYIAVQCSNLKDDYDFWFFTGSKVIIKQLKVLSNELPLVAKISSKQGKSGYRYFYLE